MTEKVHSVLFLCTGNSARSILAEAILNRLGKGRFAAYSAGSMPKGTVHPAALRLLEQLDYDISGLRSKSWDEFAEASDGAPRGFDFIFTLCDSAAEEPCPVWPGAPMRAHWGLFDPAAVQGSQAEIAAAFAEAYRMIHNRVSVFVSLPLTTIAGLSLQRELDAIGNAAGPAGPSRHGTLLPWTGGRAGR